MCLEELGSLFHDREQPALSMLFDTLGAVNNKMDESHQSALAGFSINCMFLNHKTVQIKLSGPCCQFLYSFV